MSKMLSDNIEVGCLVQHKIFDVVGIVVKDKIKFLEIPDFVEVVWIETKFSEVVNIQELELIC